MSAARYVANLQLARLLYNRANRQVFAAGPIRASCPEQCTSSGEAILLRRLGMDGLVALHYERILVPRLQNDTKNRPVFLYVFRWESLALFPTLLQSGGFAVCPRSASGHGLRFL